MSILTSSHRPRLSRRRNPQKDETPSAPAEVETAAVSQATEVTPEDIHASVTQEHPAEEDAGDYEEEDTAAFFPDSSIHAEDASNSALTSRIEPQQTGYAFSDSAVTEVASFPEVTASGEEDITVRKRQNNEGFVDTTTNHTEEILNLPSMRAEKRKHDIEEQGGLINTSETLEASEMLSTGIGRSLRHIALIVALGSAIMAWYVMQPERFVEFKSRLQSWVDKTQSDQIVTTNAEQNPDVSNRESSAAQPGESTVIANQSEADEAENSRVQTVDSNPNVDLDQSPDRQDQARDENASLGQTTTAGDFIATQTKYEQSTVEQTPVQDFSDRAQKFQIFFNEGDENIPKQFDGMLNDLFIVLTLNKKTKLKIRGYTDPSEQPIEAMRDALARAQRVSKYFIDKGIKQARIQVESHSVLPKDLQNEPRILDEKLSEGRVELILNGG
ncbi:MAG: OmpA family protein [Candidatus Thiodiazotropha sp.]